MLSRAAQRSNGSVGSDGYADLLDLDAVDELLSRRGLRTPFLRVAKDGVVLPAGRFTRPGGTGAQIGDQVADDRVLELFLDGSTLVLQGLHRVWPPLIAFAGQLTADLGHPVQVNAYITPPQSRGFSAHYDVHDVFVLQVAGHKRWSVYEPVVNAPLPDQPWTNHRAAVEKAAASPPLLDTQLGPGDALYLPRGFLHAAEALGETCAHLTVGVHPVTRWALAQALLAGAADDAELRTSLPLGLDLSDPEALRPEVEATAQALTAALGRADPGAALEVVRRDTWQATRPGPLSPLAQARALRTLDTGTRVRVRDHLRLRLRASAEHVILDLPDRTLELPAATEPALRALLAGAALAVADLPGLAVTEQLDLARRLLGAAVVVAAQP